MNRGRLAGRKLPELRKPAEMIEADVVKIVREPAHPVDPPRISLLPHHIPAIKRIPPALAVFAERIRGTPATTSGSSSEFRRNRSGRVQTSALSKFTKIAMSPTTRIECCAQ